MLPDGLKNARISAYMLSGRFSEFNFEIVFCFLNNNNILQLVYALFGFVGCLNCGSNPTNSARNGHEK